MHNKLRNTRNCFPLLDSFWLIIYSSMDLDLDPIQSDGLGHGFGITGTLDSDLDLDPILSDGLGLVYEFKGTMGLDLDMDPIQPDGLGFGYGF